MPGSHLHIVITFMLPGAHAHKRKNTNRENQKVEYLSIWKNSVEAIKLIIGVTMSRSYSNLFTISKTGKTGDLSHHA